MFAQRQLDCTELPQTEQTLKSWLFSATRPGTKPGQTDSAGCRLSSSEPPVPVHAPCYRLLRRHRRRPDSRSNEESSACRPSDIRQPETKCCRLTFPHRKLRIQRPPVRPYMTYPNARFV